MVISHLSLSNFRSHPKQTFSFSSQTTVIIGPNASGKTNILEALFLLATGKSFRAEKDSEMIAFGSEIARVTAAVRQSINEETKLEIVITTGSVHNIKTPFKKFALDGVGKRMIDFVGHLKTVLFWPEDLELVTDSPSLRRRYLDSVLIQVDREYRRCLISYEKGLRQRNRLLEAIRDQGVSRHQLMFWDQLLIKNGEYINQKREEFISFLNNFQFSSAGLENNLQLKHQLAYDRSLISPPRLAQYQNEEIAAASTLVGPHRDDFSFLTLTSGGQARDLSQFGSRGEQRLAILWLKLGELAFIQKVSTGEKPVLLLDDIFSEFDHKHREIVFGLLNKQQTIMTAADPHFIDRRSLKDIEVIEFS